jgi:pimeloyl-ACP methyl ester carboxylesterase
MLIQGNQESRVEMQKKLLFLHGMGGTGALWRPISVALEKDYEVLALDQIGHGKNTLSDPDAPYTPLEYGRDIISQLDAKSFHPTWIVGHSMGVRSACATAHLKPDWVEGLILVDLGFSGPAGGGLGEGLAQFIQMLPAGFATRAEARDFMAAHCPDPSIAQYLLAVATITPGGTGITFPFDHEALIKTIHATRDFSVRPWLLDLVKKGMRVLVLRGQESGVWTREAYLEEKAQFRGLSSIVFEEFTGAGHGLPFEKRLEFIARVKEFISA